MKLDDLLVLHIYSYSAPKGKASLLKNFLKKIKPLVISTCMRHIYIFSQEQLDGNKEHLDSLLIQMNTREQYQAPTEYQLLLGRDAYTFLLYWVAGGNNKKNPFNDHRILGDLRTTLCSIEHSSSPANQYAWSINKVIAISLRHDAKYLLKWVKSLPLDMRLIDKTEMVREACQNCTWAREQGFLDFIAKFNFSKLYSKKLMIAEILTQLDVIIQQTQLTYKKHIASIGTIGFILSMSRIHIQLKIEKARELREKLLSKPPEDACYVDNKI